MGSSLYSGVSGLLAHQRKLDVVANNLANLNTLGYKSQQINFADLIYTEISSAAGSGDPTAVGGRNPNQVGNGVRISQVSRDFQQGVLQSTGRALDMAIAGEGFFAVTDGVNRFFTRDGSFTINSAGYLTSPATGNLVMRMGTLGEPTADQIGFQKAGDAGIFVPIGSSLPGTSTSIGSFNGNLPSNAVPPRAEVQTSDRPYLAGGSPATMTTLLNDLDINGSPYTTGDTIDITGQDVDGTPFSLTVNVDATTRLGDLVSALNSQLNLATASLDASGNLVVTANDTGPSTLSVVFADGSANVGSTNFADTELGVTTEGKDGDTVFTTIQVFDERGESRSVTAEFTKTTLDTWDAAFSIPAGDGTMVDGVVRGIEFNNDGTFKQINGSGLDGADITIQFSGISKSQTISLDFSKMTHTPAAFGSFFDQNGYPTGIITELSVSNAGVIEAIASNGRRIPVAQLAIAGFRNSQGLTNQGNNYFSETVASGQAQIGPGQVAGRGQVVGGNLEQSNVDIAFEFTQLIVAQRGFSANARTITVTDNVLQELTNIVR